MKGANSGATGFLRHEVSAGTAVTVYETKEVLFQTKDLIFNGIQNGRTALLLLSMVFLM